ncbi:AAA-like domain-containing protein [Roseofilum sp. BLCC_M154]|uniref:AAA-like domain-containing protein n=1 Tax=Roseofilum acuticapitatum BLCC-M154 TaxID=3022444 RepID=A0ABT7APK7_9CYAN|nr:AAA-like domain-containing protein [Roseofilum acuticapitatum]MDJ1168838.1 AAA-like domain-containing protein [Roseofilum acuticapitatum BLCC-M154]
MRQYYQGVKGGALSLEASTYIKRLADWALYKFLTQETTQQCCYILAARQSGKTSLMIRIADQLQDAGYHCVTMNLQGFGSTVNEASLCQSLLWEIAATFPAPEARMLTQNIEQRSQEMANYPSALQFRESLKYLMEYLRDKGTEKLIVFLDEIQNLISWKLQNSFLGLLRALGQEETLKSVKFVLLGVAKPTDILTDPAVAFNTAKGIELGRLDEGDCSALIQGLAGLNCDPEQLFQEILIWTGGKPFLTQFVCNLCIEELNITGDDNISTAVQELLEQKLINNWRSHDTLSHFQEVERWYRIGYTTVEERIRALELYKQLLKQVNKIYFDGGREEQINLIVSGLAAKSEDYINVSNRLYQKVFNQRWIEETLSFLISEPMSEPEIPEDLDPILFKGLKSRYIDGMVVALCSESEGIDNLKVKKQLFKEDINETEKIIDRVLKTVADIWSDWHKSWLRYFDIQLDRKTTIEQLTFYVFDLNQHKVLIIFWSNLPEKDGNDSQHALYFSYKNQLYQQISSLFSHR